MPPTSAWLLVGLLMAFLLVVALHGLTASGHFPREHRAPRLNSRAGSMVLLGTSVIAWLSLAAGVAAGWRSVPWPAAVIGGGAVLLAAPLLLRLFPDRWVDGRGALATLTGIAAGLAAILARAAGLGSSPP